MLIVMSEILHTDKDKITRNKQVSNLVFYANNRECQYPVGLKCCIKRQKSISAPPPTFLWPWGWVMVTENGILNQLMKKETYDSWHNFTLCMLHNRTLHIGTWVELEYTIRTLHNITSHTGLTAQDLNMTICKLHNITLHTGSMAWFLNMTICKLYNITLHTGSTAWDLNNWKQINWSGHRPAWPTSSCSFPRPPESWPHLSPQTPLPHYPADHWENKSQQGKWSEHTQSQSKWENNYVSSPPPPPPTNVHNMHTVKMGK